MNVEVNEKFFVDIEEQGTVMDYFEKEFIFVMKDEMWTDFELIALKKKPIELDFVFKYNIPIFLLTLQDAIDTSDFVFNVHDNDYDETLYRTFEKGSGFLCTIYLLDKDNIVKGKRKIQLSNEMSRCIVECLKKQRDEEYFEEEFMCNLDGIQNTWEPYEMQSMALFSEKYK